ncbi:MAG: hypothetical protein COA68_08830 [Oceanobacter sp.]|nr:MAG: hypothetical protein COA68_08830 [Oceanobacter sp.]
MLRVLIVGCGRIAGGFDEHRGSTLFALTHAGAYSKRDDVRVVACVDTNLELAKAFGQRWNIPTIYSSLMEIPCTEQFDIISVCVPTTFHEETILKALEFSPRALFIEKPISMSAANSAELISRCKDKGIPVLVNYSRRWDTQVNTFFDELRSGKYGELRSVVAIYNKGIRNNGSHIIDLLFNLFGTLQPIWSEVRLGSSAHETTAHETVLDPDINAILRGPNQESIHLVCTDADDFSQFELQILTSDAELRMLDGGARWSVRKKQVSPEFSGYSRLGEEEYVSGGYFPVMEAAIEQLTSDVHANVLSYGSAESALKVEELCEQLIRQAYEKY